MQVFVAISYYKDKLKARANVRAFNLVEIVGKLFGMDSE